MKDDKNHLSYLKPRARQLGMKATKSHMRDPNALDFARYALIDDQLGTLVLGGGALGPQSCTLGDIEKHLALLAGQQNSEVTSWAR